MISNETGHQQVPFRTKSGTLVEVDEGLVEVLSSLRDLGVVTFYSCQGKKPHGGYILADGKSMSKLLAKIYYLHKRGRYSNDISWLAHRFINGEKIFEQANFKTYEQRGSGLKRHHTSKMRKLSFGSEHRYQYQIKQMYSKFYGWRVRIGWYKLEDIANIETLLRETKELLS